MSSIRPTIYKYPLDLTGVHPNNLILGEPHKLPTGENRAVIPNYGAFYTESLRVRDVDSGRILEPREQYKAIQLYQEATEETGKEVCAAVVITDKSVGDNVELDYQAVGGQFSYSALALRSAIDTVNLEEKPVTWGEIISRPSFFPPAPHLHDAGDLYGFEYLVEALEGLRRAVLIGDEAAFDHFRGLINDVFDMLQKHMDDDRNPHEVTKAQTGLGDVDNFPTANKVEAEVGERNDRFMTPLRSSELISARMISEETAKEGEDTHGLLNAKSAGALVAEMLRWFEASGTIASEFVTIPSNDYVEFDMVTLLGSYYESYDMDAPMIHMKVRNPDPQARTYNMMINAEAVATYAVHQSRYVRIYNYFEEALEFHVRITVPTIPEED